MAKYVPQLLGTSEALSPVISGLTNAVSKIADTLNMQTSTMTDYVMTEVYISETDRYRIYEVELDKKGWLSTPTPIIKKNGTAISSATDNFVIDYLGGSIEFKGTRPVDGDVLTVSATYITNLSIVLQNLSTSQINILEIIDGFKGDYVSLTALQNAVENPEDGDFGIVLGTTNNIYLWNAINNSWVGVYQATDLSNYYNKTEVDTSLATKQPTIVAQGDTSTSDNYYYGGRKTWINIFEKIRATVLTGLSTATNSVITATDTILSAFGKLQAQITANKTSADNSLTDLSNNKASAFNNTTANADILDADYLPYLKSASTTETKSTWSNIKSKLKAYFDAVYAPKTHSSTHESGGSDEIEVSANMIEDGAVSTVYTATIGTTWTGSEAPYTQALTVTGLLATDNPTVDIVPSSTYSDVEAQIDAYGKIYKMVASANALTVYATETTTVSIPIQLRAVRK